MAFVMPSSFRALILRRLLLFLFLIWFQDAKMLRGGPEVRECFRLSSAFRSKITPNSAVLPLCDLACSFSSCTPLKQMQVSCDPQKAPLLPFS